MDARVIHSRVLNLELCQDQIIFISGLADFFTGGHATQHLAVLVGMSVGPSKGHISEFRAVFALVPLPNCPRVSCRVSGLVPH